MVSHNICVEDDMMEEGLQNGGNPNEGVMPVDLTQIVLLKLLNAQGDDKSSRGVYEILYLLLGNQTAQLEVQGFPSKMEYKEATSKYKMQRSGVGFPMITMITAERDGKIKDYIDEVYMDELKERLFMIIKDLSIQGVIDWTRMQSGLGVLPHEGGGFQVLSRASR